MLDLYLCGTVHVDFKGPERLNKILDRVKPDVLVVEAPPELVLSTLEKRSKYASFTDDEILEYANQRISLEDIDVDTLKQFYNSIGYELWVSAEYASEKGIDLVPVEDSNQCASAKDLIGSDSVLGLVEALLSRPTNKSQRFIDITYNWSGSEASEDLLTISRNRTFADRIRKLDGAVLGIFGLGHIYGLEPTLPTLLSEYNPKSIRLLEADAF